MDTDELKTWAEENEVEILLADGFEEALIGVDRQFNTYLAVYDRDKCIEILVAGGMSHEDAEEYFEVNTQGAYVGKNTPVFVTT